MSASLGRGIDFNRWLLVSAAALLAVAAPMASAQGSPAQSLSESASAKPLAFEVASIKPNKEANGTAIIRPTTDGIRATDCTLLMFISWAYGYGERRFGDNEIVGAPGWAGSARYDIEARVENSEVLRLRKLDQDRRTQALAVMLQRLLADRFKLVVHQGSRELSAYDLVVMKKGPKFKEGKSPDPALPNGVLRMTSGRITANGVAIRRLAAVLEFQVERPIVDETGLTGAYDFSLEWRPQETTGLAVAGAGDSQPRSLSPSGSSAPSIFTALQNQLGLKLEPSAEKVRATTIVIDHAEKPSEN